MIITSLCEPQLKIHLFLLSEICDLQQQALTEHIGILFCFLLVIQHSLLLSVSMCVSLFRFVCLYPSHLTPLFLTQSLIFSHYVCGSSCTPLLAHLSLCFSPYCGTPFLLFVCGYLLILSLHLYLSVSQTSLWLSVPQLK